MDPVGQLSPQDWLAHEDTRMVMAALMAEGAIARFAGGCVRDAVLHLPVHDVDIAIDCPPETTMSLLQKAGIKVVPTGIDHGTVTAVMSSYSYEITTLRKDLETDGRHAVVSYSADWDADAARRDLTINALYADLDGAVYDPWEGLADLGAGRVKFVGNPEERINEDVLRLLRFFRFYGRFGSPPADVNALLACRKLAYRIPELSAERIRSEMLRLLVDNDPASLIVLMVGEGVTPYLFPCELNPGRLRVLAWLESRGIVAPGVGACPLRRLAALMSSGNPVLDMESAAALAVRWRLSNAEAERLKNAMCYPEEMQALAVDLPINQARKILYRLGEERYRDHVLLAWAKYRHQYGVLGPVPGAHGTQAWDKLLRLPQSHPIPEFPVKGRDLLAAGVPSGPEVGQVLHELETIWQESDFSANQGELLQCLLTK